MALDKGTTTGGGGDATAANQTTGNTTLGNILTGQGTGNTTLGNILTGQGTGNSTLGSLLTGQGTGNTTLGSILSAVQAATPAGENFIGAVGGVISNPSATFTRPADTTAYASGDLVANSTTAGSVVPMTITAARVAAGSFMLRRAKLSKSGTTLTNASFRVHLYRAAPGTVTNGDNGAWSTSGLADYLGAFDITMDRAFTDGACGIATPVVGSELSIKLASGQTVRALIEARAAYTPANAEVFTLEFDALLN